ncbi:alkaline phosphatase D family protein [Sphingobium boeckii]|uniref:Alkaline phosphatase D n=1 Tax=Sphingobium boeckii TaxID=1082345 RepID=A0A7W9EEN7_9SPHN|nr:alkaline phosphatase D family protein [Sphingobium boeckii]MBB5684861.1 alkaline phosphatase D [Sphingobium boeckii]
MSKTFFDRRTLIKLGAAFTLLGAASPARLLAAPGFRHYPFTLGVAAGDPTPEGFVLWTRLAPEPMKPDGGMPPLDVRVRWEVAEDAAFRRIVRSGTAIARAGLAHSVHVEVDGLRSHRPHWYRFLVAGADASPVGCARTAPAAGAAVDRLRVAMVGCQNFEMGYFTAYAHLARETDLDAVFHYGDYIYELGPGATVGPRRHVGNELASLADYRQRYAQYKVDPDLQAAHGAAAFIMSFDDHEIDDNWAGALDKDGNSAAMFAPRKAAALQAWYEHVPVRRAQLPGPHSTMYRRLDYGSLVRMHILDTRSHRSDQQCERLGMTAEERSQCPRIDRPERTMLGAAQEAWLDRGLANEARWNLIAQQVMVMPHDSRKDGSTVTDTSTDNWNGYPLARQRLIDSIHRRRLTNVVIGSGDAHQNYIGAVPLDVRNLEGPAIASDFLAASISSGGTGGVRHPDEQDALSNNPNMRLINNQRGYHLHTIAADRWQTEVKAMDQVDRPGGSIATLATFHVDPRRPGPELA